MYWNCSLRIHNWVKDSSISFPIWSKNDLFIAQFNITTLFQETIVYYLQVTNKTMMVVLQHKKYLLKLW